MSSTASHTMTDLAMTDPSLHHHAHHFRSAAHEFAACKQGMWLFLVQEVLFFSGLFVAYVMMRGFNFEAFHDAAKFLDWRLGAINTVILIVSSVTMVMAVTSAQTGKKKETVRYLIATFFLACGFCVVKYFEWTHKFHMGILPGGSFLHPSLFHPKLVLSLGGLSLLLMGYYASQAKGGLIGKKAFWIYLLMLGAFAFLVVQYLGFASHHGAGAIEVHGEEARELIARFPKAPLFFSCYFMMTGVHALHVVGGMIVILWLISRAEDGEFTPAYYTPVEMVGLYWHFVDLVWIYLFPLLYLVG